MERTVRATGSAVKENSATHFDVDKGAMHWYTNRAVSKPHVVSTPYHSEGKPAERY